MKRPKKRKPSAPAAKPGPPVSSNDDSPPPQEPARTLRAPRGRPFLVAVVDDEPDVLKSVELILEETEEFQTAGFYPTGHKALAGILTQPPDVVLMDIRLPDLSGIECTRRLTAGLPNLRVVMMSALDDRRTMEDAIRAGCHGYLTKPFGSRQCLAMLRCALAARLIDPSLARLSVDECPLRRNPDASNCFSFSDRDVKILGALCDGRMYKEIADELKIADGLAHKLINGIYRKLRVHTRHEALRRWLLCSRCSNWALRARRRSNSNGRGNGPVA